jgi:hypothetical protein
MLPQLPALIPSAGTIDLKIDIGCLRVPPAPAILCVRAHEHDAEKWVPVFGKDHAPTKMRRGYGG